MQLFRQTLHLLKVALRSGEQCIFGRLIYLVHYERVMQWQVGGKPVTADGHEYIMNQNTHLCPCTCGCMKSCD